MKVCFLSCLYSEEKLGGGVRTYIKNMSKSLSDMGDDITVVTSGPKGNIYYEEDVRVVQVGEIEVFKNNVQLTNPFYLLRRVLYMWNAASFIKRSGFDIVEAADGGFEQLLLVFKNVCPVITRMHGKTADTKRVVFRAIFDVFEKLVLIKSDAVNAPAKSYAEYVAEKYRISDDDIDIIPCGVNLDNQYERINVREKYNLSGKKIILFVGMLCRRKGIDLVVDLAKRVQDRNDIVFVVLGEMLEKYDETEFPDNILYLGYRSGGELYSFYETCHLFLSSSRFETFGINVAEAMSFGKPILASKVVGLKDVVMDGRNGLFFNPDDRDDLFKKFSEMIDNKKLLGNFSRESKDLSLKYDIKRIAQKTHAYYKRISHTWQLSHKG